MPCTRRILSHPPAWLVLAALLLLTMPQIARAALPATLETAQYDWVCVTADALVEAYAPLAAHREAQGLDPVVISLSEAIRWSPAGDDTTATLRWLAGVAQQQWGARYLLLGGSHALLPAPIHRLQTTAFTYDHPTDAYFACLDGEWDVDGDGLAAEWGEDAANPVIHLSVGRVPADSPSTVENVVNKIIAFETRPVHRTNGALFISSLMDRLWEEGKPYPNWALAAALDLRDTVQAYDPDLRAGLLLQGQEVVDPEGDPLNETALVDSLGARSHDFVFCQVYGIGRAWELVYPRTLGAGAFDPLVDTGHGFLLAMVSGSVADSREPGVLSHLLTLRSGGAVAAVAPTGMVYLTPSHTFQDLLWPRLTDRSQTRLGDAFTAAQTAFVDQVGWVSSFVATNYWFQSLQGDPATLIRSLAEQTTPAPHRPGPVHVQVVPNPFNPETAISFTVDGRSGDLLPVRVEIFDLQGRRVETLLDQLLPPGPREIPWRAGGGSGLYFVRVTVGDREQTVKLTLIE